MSWIDTAHCSTAVSENFCEVLHSLFCCRFGSEIRVWILTEDHRDSSGEKERVKARGAGGGTAGGCLMQLKNSTDRILELQTSLLSDAEPCKKKYMFVCGAKSKTS